MNATIGGDRPAENLKILIVSTPKTGNTWVKNLLANVYQLPIVDFGMAFDAEEATALGSRWVAHQHYAARPELVDWLVQNDVVLVTTLRHPCDALVSMYHFVHDLGDRLVFADVDRAPVMARDGGAIGEHTASYVLDGYNLSLDISLSWMRAGVSHLVRYEDLKSSPISALKGLTDAISEVPLERIRRAVAQCDFQRMRKTAGADPKFYRKGQVGRWRLELPEQILDIFRDSPPYPIHFAALSYSLDSDFPVDAPAIRPASLEQVRATATVNSHWAIAWPQWPSGIGPKIAALAQKVVRRLLRWYIDPIIEQQNDFNTAVADALDELWQETQLLREELSREKEDE
jgi:hypothetical protein